LTYLSYHTDLFLWEDESQNTKTEIQGVKHRFNEDITK